MREELKIMTWNIRGSASCSWSNYQIKKDVVDKIVGQKADIAILTEFVLAKGIEYLFAQLKAYNYIWFQTCESGENGIFICVQKEIIKGTWFDKKATYSLNEGLNLFKIRLELKNGKYLSVLGCRMKTSGYKKDELEKQYNDEAEIFYEKLLPEIIKLKSYKYKDDIIVVGGDFNNAQCRGALDTKFDEMDYKKLAQHNYNLNIIKDEFENLGYIMADIADDKKSSIPTLRHMGHKIPDDHIFLRGAVSNNCEVLDCQGLSDHDALLITARMLK